jgi:poly(3-hydroxyalkanoate) synthetase
VDTGGRSPWHGLKNYFDDLSRNGGMPSMVDQSAFKVGVNLATTPGAVILRNDSAAPTTFTPPPTTSAAMGVGHVDGSNSSMDLHHGQEAQASFGTDHIR